MKIHRKAIDYYVEDEGHRYKVISYVSTQGATFAVWGAVGIHDYCRHIDEESKIYKRVVERLRTILPPANLKIGG